MDLQDIFISNLKRFRKLRHITQEELAERCNTETSYIGQIEIRKRFPSLPLIEKIAEALEIQAYQLYKPVESEEKKKSLETLKTELQEKIGNDIDRIITDYIE